MKNKLKHLNVEYLGIDNPKTPTEIQFEILGLKTVIAEAESRISQLEQGAILAKLITEEKAKENDNHISRSRRVSGKD